MVRCRFPVLLDLVGDEVRSRGYNVLLLLSIFAVVISVLVTPGLPSAKFLFTNENSGVDSDGSGQSMEFGIIIFAILLIPLFLVNSINYSAWTLIIAVPMIGGGVYLGVDNVQSEAVSLADNVMKISCLIVFCLLALSFLRTAFHMIFGKSQTGPDDYHHNKRKAFHDYTKKLFTYGSKNFKDKKEHQSLITYTDGKVEKKPLLQTILNKIGDIAKSKLDSENLRFHIRSRPDFFYPQRFLIAVFCGLYFGWFLLFICLYVTEFIVDILEALDSVLDAVAAMTQNDESTQFAVIYSGMFSKWATALRVTGQIASPISFLISAILVGVVMLRYKKRIMELRQGKYFFAKSAGDPIKSTEYVGMFVMHVAIAVFFMWMIFMAGIGILVSPFLRNFLITKIVTAIFLFLGLPLIRKLITLLMKFLLVSNGMVVHRRAFSILEFIFLIISVIGSITSVIMRFIKGSIFSFLKCLMMDSPLFEVINDPGFIVYVSMMKVDHQHNNPVVCTAIDKMLEGSRQRKTKNMKRERIINRYWLAVTLHHNPSLRPLCKRTIKKTEVENLEVLVQPTQQPPANHLIQNVQISDGVPMSELSNSTASLSNSTTDLIKKSDAAL